MKTGTIFICMAAVVFGCVASSVFGSPNLVLNPGFEGDESEFWYVREIHSSQFWRFNRRHLSRQNPKSGANCVKLELNEDSKRDILRRRYDKVYSQTFDLKGGKNYRLSMSVRIPKGTSYGLTGALYMMNANSIRILHGSDRGRIELATGPGKSFDSWKTLTTTFSVPETIGWGRFVIVLFGKESETATAFVDDLELVEVK